ncbi:MAG: heparinase II/III family protein [Sedimentisphaerales bacterium]|nr:heparinase II/III family protein [Sedimentisphaerales bacterium]
MKHYAVSIIVCGLCVSFCIGTESTFRDIPMEEIQAAFRQSTLPHPRLFISDKEIASIQKKIQSQSALQAYYQAMLSKADSLIDRPPVKRIKTGRRLLSVSRECLDRVVHLSAAYQLTGKRAYLQRAEKEMLAAAAFSDWNPSHFLDVAEMTAALAIGYDWLYKDLSTASRQTIRQAILEKGLEPSLKQTGWVRGHNNWNQVCNGGITLGALAIMEEEPELARKLVHRAVNGVQVVMKEYEPDGAYPEGPGYWVYGTSYNVILLAALESVLGTDFGLSQAPGFARSAEYYLHVTGPIGLYFNYPDSGSRGGFLPTVFWFAQKYNQPSLAWHQYQLWEQASLDNPSTLVQSRFSPLVLLWSNDKQAIPNDLSWMGRGSNSVAMFRSSWTDLDAVYLAIKGGSPGVSHGHMDVGSFVLDAQGVRWAVDLGPENYHKIESLGMNLWSGRQNAERWTIFRYNNFSHNTLVVNDQHQRVSGNAPIIRYSDNTPFPHVVIDLSKVYEGQLAEAVRGAALLPSSQVVIQDEFKAADQPAKVRWAMVTPAEVSVENNNNALLKKAGKTMRLTVLTEAQVQLRTYSTEPKADYDAPNPNTRLIGFEVSLSSGQAVRTTVLISPLSENATLAVDLPSVRTWSAP